jgi:hypothetical protein
MYKLAHLSRLCAMSAVVLSVGLAVAPVAHAQRKPLTLNDMKALEKSQNWQELAQSLGDLPPSKRDAQWEAIATNAALQLLDKSALSKTLGDSFNVAENVLEQFPQLSKNKSFMSKRAEVGIKSIRDCYGQNRWSAGLCNNELTRFVERDPSNDNLQFVAAKLLRLNNRHAFGAPYFDKALSKSATAARCSDEDVGLAVVSAMRLPYTDDFKDQIVAAQAITAKHCTAQMKPLLLNEAEPATSYFVTNACPVMKKIAADEPVIQKTCS